MIALALVLLAQAPTPPLDSPPAAPPPAPPAAAAPAPAAPEKKSAPAKEKTVPKKGTIVVGTHKTSKGAAIEISVGDCAVAKGAPAGTVPDCAVYVALKGKKKEKLQWTAKPGAIYQQAERNVAVGDEADTALTIWWTPVTVAADKKGKPTVEGLVVSLKSGGERVKHRHDVFLVVGGKLTYALTASEPRGPMTWSSITPLDMDGNGGQELLLMHAQRPDEEEADRYNLDVYGWRADVAKVVKLPSWAPTIHAAVLGSFNNVKEARELQSSKCLREFIVLDNKSMPLLQDNTFVVAFPAATPADADLAMEAAKACDDELVGAVKILAKGMDVGEGGQ